MNAIDLRPIDIEHDFGQLAELFTLEDDPISEPDLVEDYKAHQERIFRLMAAVDEQGNLMGFNWATRSRFDPAEAYFYIIVKPERRGQGAGRLLYQDFEQAAIAAQVKLVRASVWDDRPTDRAFAERRGFTERAHRLAMELDLSSFDDRPYEQMLESLRSQGFEFTSMEALGNTEEAQRRLYSLNDATSMDTPGSEGEHPWTSFEDFQQKVCQSNWYIPAGQKVAIDTASGDWAAMSAITRFKGAEHAYNLHTGVARTYRGRKLAQAVKITALRYAREALQVTRVRTHHNSRNDPMIAIDRKFGYYQIRGTYAMEKNLASD